MNRNDTIGYKMRLIHNRIHKRMEEKRRKNEGDLTGMQRWLMGFLMEREGEDVYQRDIEAAFSVSRATASNMLQVMERRGLILRVSVEHDARLKKILLTERAKKMLEQAEMDVKETEELLTMGMSEEEIAQLNGYLNHILENLGVEQGDHCR